MPEALLAVVMAAREHLGLSVVIMADGTRDLFLQVLHSFLDWISTFSHDRGASYGPVLRTRFRNHMISIHLQHLSMLAASWLGCQMESLFKLQSHFRGPMDAAS